MTITLVATLGGRDRLACFDQSERLSTHADDLAQIPLLHLQPPPDGLDGGSKPSVHGHTIPEPGRHVNLAGRRDSKVDPRVTQPVRPGCRYRRGPGIRVNPLLSRWLSVAVMSAHTEHTVGSNERLAILVGAPDPVLRQRLTSALRLRGHEVLEAGDAQDMRDRLAEHADRTDKPLDLILCGGLFAEKEDPELAQRLTSPEITRALVLIPAGGFLSTAARAQRLGANAVMGELPVVADLREILEKAAGGSKSSSEGQAES